MLRRFSKRKRLEVIHRRGAENAEPRRDLIFYSRLALRSLRLATSAQATLVGRDINGLAVAGSSAVFLYDTDLNITSLRSANAGAGSSFDDGFSTTDGYTLIRGQIPIKNSVFHENMEQKWILTFIFSSSKKKHPPSLNGWQVFALCGERPSVRKVLADRTTAMMTP